MKVSEEEIQKLLDDKLPDGPATEYDSGAQDMALWILGIGFAPDIGED